MVLIVASAWVCVGILLRASVIHPFLVLPLLDFWNTTISKGCLSVNMASRCPHTGPCVQASRLEWPVWIDREQFRRMFKPMLELLVGAR